MAFSPDEKKLYVVEWKGTPNRSRWSFDVNTDGTLGNKTQVIDAADQGALDGFRVDRDAKPCFGGPKGNRLYMASCHSLYALYVEAHGAV